MDQLTREFGLLVNGYPESQAELSIVFKQRIRPSRPAVLSILRPRSSRQVATIDGGAAGRVGDHGPVPKELRNQLEIRRLAAPGTCPGKFKQGLLHLLLANIRDLDLSAIKLWDLEEEFPVLPLRRAQRRLRRHVDGFQA